MYERFVELLKEKNMSVAEFCRQTGMSKSTFSDWKNGKFKLKEDKRKLICAYFGVSLAWLDGETDQKDGTSPVYNVAAGEGAYNGSFAIEYKLLDEEGESELEGYSWCRVEGDSMYPNLMDGDLIKVQHQTETSPSDYTIVKVDGEHATCKFVEIVENGVWLRAINKEVYEDRFFTIQEVMTLPVTIIGKAVEMRRDINGSFRV